jgi:hypothetical protein
MRRIPLVALVPPALLAAACAPTLPTAKAAEVMRLECDPSATGESEARLLGKLGVLGVEPLYSHILTGNNNSEDRVNGAKILIRPPEGVSTEMLTRTLQCHNARVVLGRPSGATDANDPYWLADGWLDIDVTSEQGNYAVRLSADSISNGLVVLGRANRYADEHMLATGAASP